jgi:hypothetical protein
MDQNKLPRLRQDIQIFPATLREQRVFVVNDPLGLSSEPAVIPEAHAVFLSMFDGENTVRDLQMRMMHLRGNVLVLEEEVKRFIEELDSHYLLDTARYQDARQRAYMEFAALPVRPAHLAGKSYPGKREELLDFMDELFRAAGDVPTVSYENLHALIVPHIDLNIGKRAYSPWILEHKGS